MKYLLYYSLLVVIQLQNSVLHSILWRQPQFIHFLKFQGPFRRKRQYCCSQKKLFINTIYELGLLPYGLPLFFNCFSILLSKCSRSLMKIKLKLNKLKRTSMVNLNPSLWVSVGVLSRIDVRWVWIASICSWASKYNRTGTCWWNTFGKSVKTLWFILATDDELCRENWKLH